MKKSAYGLVLLCAVFFSALLEPLSAQPPPPPPVFFPIDHLPPNGDYVSPPTGGIQYANGWKVRNIIHHNLTPQSPPPGPAATTYQFEGLVDMEFSMDGGETYQPFRDVQSTTQVLVHPPTQSGETRQFETEIVSMSLSGTPLPSGFMIRESPTQPTFGPTMITRDSGGGFHIDSFFDIFTELSTNGGMNWIPGGPVRLNLAPSLRKTGQICGKKWEDKNGNGVMDAGELGLAGWKVQLTLPDGGVIWVVTNAAGEYCFPNLNPGRYRVEELLEPGWMQTGGQPYYLLDVADGQPIRGIDFGNFRNGAIYGNKWNDKNGNGIKDAGEEGLANWMICLTRKPDDDRPPSTFPTSGGMDFLGNTQATIILSPYGVVPQHDIILCAQGPTTVRRADPSGGSPNDSMLTEITLLELKGNLPPPDFPGNEQFIIRHKTDRRSYGAIQGNNFPSYSFFDVFFEIEVPSMGLTMVNKDPTKMETTIHTIPPNGQNYFGFNTYLVRKDPPHDTLYVVKSVNHCVLDPTGGASQCERAPCPKPPQPDPPSPNGDPQICVLTDEKGNYCFMDLPPGTYTVMERQQEGWMQTGGQPWYTITMGSGEVSYGVDFGNSQNGAIYGQKFNDLDGDGVKDAGEPGLGGWTICLTREPDARPPDQFPTTGGTDFLGGTLATVNLNLHSSYGGGNVNLCAFGNTTVQRADPSGTAPSDSMLTEITVLDMVGKLPLPFPNDTFRIRHVADRRSFGQIKGNSFPAISFFDVFYELDLPVSLGGGTYLNYQATQMGTTINTIPPGGANYLGFNTVLVNKNNPNDTLGTIKFVNHCVLGENQPGAERCQCGPKAPPNPIPPNSPVGTSCVVTDTNGNYCFMDLPPGVYYVREVPQEGWNQTTPDSFYTVTLEGGGSITGLDFGNREKGINGSICLKKYYDINHNQEVDPDEPPMADVCFNLIDQAGNEIGGCTDEEGNLCFSGLTPGPYTLTEKPLPGYTVSKPKGGISNLEVGSGENLFLIWMNAAVQTDSSYRTASMEEWAQARDAKGKLKAVKCVPDRVAFKFNLSVPVQGSLGARLRLEFSTEVLSGTVYDGKEKENVLATFSGKKVDIPFFPPLDDGHVVQVDGIGKGGRPIKVKFAWGDNRSNVVTEFKRNDPLLPLPNLVNVGEELQRQQAFPFTTGAARDSHSVVYLKYNDVQKSLLKVVKREDVLHTRSPRCLDVFDKDGVPLQAKRMLKQQKSLPPLKHDNRLYAEALALQLNILASDKAKFPVGFGELIWDSRKYDEICGGYFNGKTVREISRQINEFLACGTDPKPGATAGDYYCVAWWLNRSFRCPIDTLRWSCTKLFLTGCHPLKDVPYLRGNPDALPPYIEPESPVVAKIEPLGFGLGQNYPNPFNPVTSISFGLPEDALVTLKVYNALGQEVGTVLELEEFVEGEHEIEFDASQLPSGIYFYRIVAQGLGDPDEGVVGQIYTSVKKMLFVK